MKLTQYHKQAIVAAIMSDLPALDKVARTKRAQKLVAARMSPDAKRLYNKAPTALAGVYLDQTRFGIQTGGHYLKAGNLTQEQVEEILAPLKAEAAAYNQLKDRVTNAVNGCSTRKSFIDQYPEFRKYAPSEASGITPNLPAVANLIADLVTAGWKQTISKGAKK